MQRGVWHWVVGHSLGLEGIALHKILSQWNRGGYLEAIRLVRRPEVVPTQTHSQGQAASHAIGIRAVEAEVVFNEGSRLCCSLRKGTAVLVELIGVKIIVHQAQDCAQSVCHESAIGKPRV